MVVFKFRADDFKQRESSFVLFQPGEYLFSIKKVQDILKKGIEAKLENGAQVNPPEDFNCVIDFLCLDDKKMSVAGQPDTSSLDKIIRSYYSAPWTSAG